MTSMTFHNAKYLEFSPYPISWVLVKALWKEPHVSMNYYLPLDALMSHMAAGVNTVVLRKLL